MKSIFTDKLNRLFLGNEFICIISYGIVFDLMMLILTNYIHFDASYASIFIIGCNMLGTIFSFMFSKVSKGYSVGLSAFIKYGTRGIVYLIAFFSNSIIIFIFAIIYAFISCRLLEDKVTGSFVTLIEEENQFLFGNLRYLAMTLGEGIGAFLAGIFLEVSLNRLFLGAGVITIIQTLIYIYLGHIREKKLKIS